MAAALCTEKRWILAITGASGTIYGSELARALISQHKNLSLDIILSEAALRVMREEENLHSSVGKLSVEQLIGSENPRVTIHSNRNIGATIASGSYHTDGMVIVPCSMKTLAGIAHGYCENLVLRAADVTLKEKRKLVLVPRETPLSVIHLENMLKLATLGVSIVPAMPGFYQHPLSIQDLVQAMVQRIADQLELPLQLVPRWGEQTLEPSVRVRS